MLYDGRIQRALIDVERAGFVGEKLTLQVYKTLGIDVDDLSKRERELLEDAFVKLVHPAAKRTAAKASTTRTTQSRLIV